MTRWTVAEMEYGQAVALIRTDLPNRYWDKLTRAEAVDLACQLILATHANIREIEVTLDREEGKRREDKSKETP